jgi:hypothetical protein
MAVVISDFEVVAEPPPNEPAPGPAGEAGAPGVVLTPQELELLLERQEERAARLRAH